MISARMRFAGAALPDWITRVQSLICSAGVAAASLAHQPRSRATGRAPGRPGRPRTSGRQAGATFVPCGPPLADCIAPPPGVSTFRRRYQPARPSYLSPLAVGLHSLLGEAPVEPLAPSLPPRAQRAVGRV